VLLGVNNDEDRALARKTADRLQMTWRSCFDAHGLIVSRWGVDSWPTTFVVDAKGVIRYLNVRGDELDKAAETLLAESAKK
jgi:hypothetical protein